MGLADHYELAKKLKRMSLAHVPAQAADPDWGVVMLFYSALHVTTAYLITVGSGAPRDHTAMRAAIDARPELDQRFRDAYSALSRFSWNVRYNPGYVMRPIDHQVASTRFVVVRAFVEAAVRAALNLPVGNEL